MRRSDGSGAAAASDTMSLLGMICGISGFGLLFVPCISFGGIILNLLGIALSGVALSRIGRGEASGKGMALTGLISGILGLLLYLVGWLIVLIEIMNEEGSW